MIFRRDFADAEISEREKERREKLAFEVTEDFERRREARRALEGSWIVNVNFFGGNQYCDLSPNGELIEDQTQFYWQNKRVFNHIAPTVDTRIAKLTRLRPVLRVRAFSDEDSDVKSAKLATGVLAYVRERARLDEVAARVTLWSETCGSAFFKVVWDEQGGRQVGVGEDGEGLFEGEVSVSAVPPFEIFPDDLSAESLDEVGSLIHARTVSADYIKERFGTEVAGKEIEELGYGEPRSDRSGVFTGLSRVVRENAAVLIERYTRPTADYPKGRLEIVAGGVLLYEGELPYRNGERGTYAFPFVKQDCLRLPGAFFASSVVDRLLPVQRAYNAVRNRKHEFLNRAATGVLTVEDGAVDSDELAEEGLAPGKILVYRQGGKAPEFLDCGKIPAEFAVEEEWLEREFTTVSGVSELSQNSNPARVTSASGLQLLITQDDSRLAATLDNTASATKELGRQTLRLYRQFAGSARLLSVAGEGGKVQAFYFNAAELGGADVVFESDESVSPEEKKETLMKLFEAGLFGDEDGKVSESVKHRILEAYGFGSYENVRDLGALHISKAEEENLLLQRESVAPDGYDDHGLHIAEHVRYLLSSEFRARPSAEVKARFEKHLEEHKKYIGQK